VIGDRLRQAILELIRTNTPRQVTICKVVAIDEEKLTCTVQELESGQELFQVRLNAASTALQTVLIPAVDSIVLVALIGNNRQSRFVAMVSEVDKIYLNGGENGGLTITPKLVEELNKTNELLASLINIINGTPVPEPGNGSPSALQTALKNAIVTKSLGDYSAIENQKIKH